MGIVFLFTAFLGEVLPASELLVGWTYAPHGSESMLSSAIWPLKSCQCHKLPRCKVEHFWRQARQKDCNCSQTYEESLSISVHAFLEVIFFYKITHYFNTTFLIEWTSITVSWVEVDIIHQLIPTPKSWFCIDILFQYRLPLYHPLHLGAVSSRWTPCWLKWWYMNQNL